jgi:hypothetical protein
MEKDKSDVLDAAMPKLIFVQSTWIGAFLEPIPPKLAYERALWMKHLLPKNYTHLKQIKMILHWTRCACVKGVVEEILIVNWWYHGENCRMIHMPVNVQRNDLQICIPVISPQLTQKRYWRLVLGWSYKYFDSRPFHCSANCTLSNMIQWVLRGVRKGTIGTRFTKKLSTKYCLWFSPTTKGSTLFLISEKLWRASSHKMR